MKRILVVDDDEKYRNSLRTALEIKGYEVLEAADPLDAYDIAVAEKPDKILCDTSLGEKNGIELAIDLVKEVGIEADNIIGMSGENRSSQWKGCGFAFAKKEDLNKIYRLIEKH